jgi:hypothetical protein
MRLHLDEIATKVTPGAHSSSIKPGGMAPKALKVPSNISPMRCRRARPNSTDRKTSRAAELAVESGVQIIRRYCRPLPLGLEHAHRSALEDHVHRSPPRTNVAYSM